MKTKTDFGSKLTIILLLPVVIASVIPLLATFGYSFFMPEEMTVIYREAERGIGRPPLFPAHASLKQFYELIIGKPKYMRFFWNSVGYTSIILLGQMLLGFPVAYVLAVKKFRLRGFLFFTLLFVMLMPFQVVMVPNYIGMRWLGLLGKPSAVVIPFVFSPFPVVILTMFVTQISRNVMEAARIDGVGTIGLMTRIILPLARPGIAALIILSFIDSWNMVEQPLVFLEEEYLYPMSLALGQINDESRELAFAAVSVYALPAIYIFLVMKQNLVRGISALGNMGVSSNET